MVNKVILIGNLGQRPEVRNMESGAAVARLSVATNEAFRRKDSDEWETETQWHTVIAWRFLAERVGEFQKGELVYIEGKMTYRTYEAPTGEKRYYAEIVASTIRRMGKSKDPGAFPTDEYPTDPNPPLASQEPVLEGEDKDLPF